MDNRLFETYKDSLILHGHHIYQTSPDMAISIMCDYPPSYNLLMHWKCVLCCCSNLPHIDLSGQESDRHNYNKSPTIKFHVYHLIAHCTVHGRPPMYKKKKFRLFLCDPASVPPEKYTQ